ncbi:MAG: 2-amino-4-hydroxy-6-hydroxymethyldihydropteridine diphosphokinase [Fidelibacterota bacterium]
MTEPVTVFLSLGSNLGDPFFQVERGIDTMNYHPLISIRKVSPFYRTEPVEAPGQAEYINCVVELSTSLDPQSLLEVCHDVEEQSGRIRGSLKNSPRTLDMDIIFYGGHLIKEESLTIPHPRYAQRRFVLEPLVDIAPDFICPDSDLSTSEALQRCEDFSRVELLEPEDIS